jgi:hypothetical protein
VKNFKATTLQYVFAGIIVLLLGIVVGVFLLAQQAMSRQFLATDHARIDAELVQEEIVRLQQLKTNLENDNETVEKTERIVAESQQYEYQDQVVNDINSYARQYGIDVISFDFGAKPGPTTNSSSGGSAQQKSIVQIQLNEDITYEAFLKFIKSIEQNITKMQLTGISIQPNTKNPQLIQGPSLEIEVFLR